VVAVAVPAPTAPGPDSVGVVPAALTRGPPAGLLTTSGVILGLGACATSSLVGPAALSAPYQWLAVALRTLGGCRLVYLGVRLPPPAAP
jgi:threonine/homoserine/homoserine lactone efflux protein